MSSLTAQELKNLLAQTLEDRRLTRSERRALSQVLGDEKPNAQSLAVYRHTAFDLARDALPDAESQVILDWLEDAIKLFQPGTAANRRERTADSFFSPQDNCPDRIAGLLKRSSQSVDICVFTITDNRIATEVLATHRRGIPVRIISDDEKADDAGSDIARLAQAGISVRVDRTRYHMHHKFALFDQRLLLTGSYNWTRGAAEYNEENFIVSSEQRFLISFSEVFEKLWSQCTPH